ncbi:MAG: FMN-binding negative transcriptional regulator, partial [Granulosicoccus sp.]|nr:FMN-binding negative transcriptional regulator [Granulosicoccus sp.]
ARLIKDHKNSLDNMERLVAAHEKHQPTPWTMSRVAPDMLETMLKQIVSFEIEITAITGKEKLSQNRPAVDRESAIATLRRSKDHTENAIAELMHQKMTES